MPLDDVSTAHGYEPATAADKMLGDYLNCSILEVRDLCIIDYLSLLRDAYIYRLDSTERGRELLGVAWRTERFGGKADRASLRRITGGTPAT